jgi:hypothetical protein
MADSDLKEIKQLLLQLMARLDQIAARLAGLERS